MEHISNAQKAREIADNAHSSSYFPIEDCETFDVKLLGKTVKRRDIDSLKPEIRRAIKYGAITMGVWKDEQNEQEKQQWIDKAAQWFGNYLFEIGYPDDWLRDSPNTINGKTRFIQAMKEE